MSFFAQPSTNLHSPGPIGDVTPNTVGATTIGTSGVIAGSAAITAASFIQTQSYLQAVAGICYLHNILLKETAAGELSVRDIGDAAFTAIKAKLTTDTNATTGLVAGVLASTTNTSILLYDATGTAYDVPCKVH